MRTKKAWTIALVIGLLLMLASMVATVAFAMPLSNDPGRAIVGNANFWYEYYFHKTSWLLILGGCVSAVSCAMLVIRKK